MPAQTAKSRLIRLLTAVLAILLPASVARGQCEIAKLLATDGAAEDGFGNSVSVSGDVAVVGASGDDDNGASSGSTYVFRFNPAQRTWLQQGKLTASDAAANAAFAFSVSISGDVVVIGDFVDDDNGIPSGSVYVFVKPADGWADMTETAKLTASDGAIGDAFGFSVSICGNVVIVGAPGDDDNGADSGSVYVFVKPPGGWVDMTETAKLTASDAEAGELFGNSVSISGELLGVGAFRDDDNGAHSGSAYLFRFNGSAWVREGKLTASDGALLDHFGSSVSVSGDVVAVGAPGYPMFPAVAGKAYLFVKPAGGWVDMTETAKLSASDGAALDHFGASVSIGDDVAVVGAWLGIGGKPFSGAAYVFERPPGGWVDMTETAKLTASDSVAGDAFGRSVSIAPNGMGVALVGASGDGDNGTNSGSAYVFDVVACLCAADLDADGSVGILDLLALLAAWGTDPSGPPDFDADGSVGILDLLELLTNWGPCP